MKRKIVGLFVCVMLIGNVLHVAAYEDNNTIAPLKNDDSPIVNVTLPDAHLYYHTLKFRFV